PSADHVAQHIVDHDVGTKSPEPLQYLERGDDTPARTSHSRLRAPGFHAPDSMVATMYNVVNGERSVVAPFTHKVHNSGDEPALHQHPGTVPLGVAPDLQHIEALLGERGREIGRSG